jgi:hypothetical protein
MTTNKPIIVDANYRFIAAYQEVNARISQRQQALALYVTLVVSLLAALVAFRPGPVGSDSAVEWLLLGFPVASVCLAALNYKAERAITNLRRFLSALEQLGDGHHILPSYNTDPRWALDANRARRFHDMAAALLVAGGNAVGLGAFLNIHAQRAALHPWIVVACAAVALVTVVVLLLIPRWSYRPPSQNT